MKVQKSVPRIAVSEAAKAWLGGVDAAQAASYRRSIWQLFSLCGQNIIKSIYHVRIYFVRVSYLKN